MGNKDVINICKECSNPLVFLTKVEQIDTTKDYCVINIVKCLKCEKLYGFVVHRKPIEII